MGKGNPENLEILILTAVVIFIGNYSAGIRRIFHHYWEQSPTLRLHDTTSIYSTT